MVPISICSHELKSDYFLLKLPTIAVFSFVHYGYAIFTRWLDRRENFIALLLFPDGGPFRFLPMLHEAPAGGAPMQQNKQQLIEIAWLGSAIGGLCFFGTFVGVAIAIVLSAL